MNSYDYIKTRQIQWAKNQGIELVGSKVEKGTPAYTRTLDHNLFEPLTAEHERSFRAGDGGELGGYPAKMQAVHSSSALAVNVFQYWDSRHMVEVIAHACGLCNRTTDVSESISFEVKFAIDERFPFSPNIDVVINNAEGFSYQVYAIESKFSEAYGGYEHSGLKEKYLALDIWGDTPHLHELAKSISPNDSSFKYLHAAQLVKHILGLHRAYGKTHFRLLYLWYDALGSDGAVHRDEIARFMETVKADDIAMHEISYQELITRLAEGYRDSHGPYIKYLTNRYF